MRDRATRAIVSAAVLLVTFGVGAPAHASTSLLVPQSAAFSVLGHSCGGIQEQALATGFDATTGYPTGDVYLQTRCGGSGRGGGYHVTTYAAWVGATWDLTGAMVAFARLASAPGVIDPTFSAVDAFGNVLANALSAVNVLPDACTVTNTTYCTYRAYLTLAPGFVPPPRVTGISATSGPATGGTGVTITGTGFTGATAVTFGGTPAASFVVNGDTSIAAVSPPAAAGAIDVTVTTPGGTSPVGATDVFTFLAAPVVSAIDPAAGTVDGGTLVTITGSGFVDVVGVSFGDTPAGFTVNDATSISAVAPPAEATDTVDVTVVTVGGTSAASAADRFTYTPSAPASVCGDGVVDPGEECDDGAANGAPGDCCAITCTFQPAGTPCADDGSLCTADACDGGGACLHAIAPAPGCTPPDVATGASLLLRRSGSGANHAQFQWSKGPAVPLADFGDPLAGDRLELCVYSAAGPDGYALALDGAPSTSAGAWTASATGWKFRSRTGAPDGITGVTLVGATVPLKAKIQVKATNSPSFGPLPVPAGSGVVAQVRSSAGPCWEATFSTPTVTTATAFKARSD